MTSRRPMTRSFSGNGRTSSFSEEEGSSSNGRSESRNNYLSNVRPENRSTLCSVMAQLTEDIQPCFETTLKSKAVSENCNVKFSCVVTGYPAPELKWYKDDMEMDRYCGLPKYEIHRNGKTHTLHIYNCTLDDAAIYQVSASNSKGIVSCSGVLEVGTMNEFKIHQRFFAKLKQKAEKKKHEMEIQNKKEDKGTIQNEKPQASPERPPRKRHIPPPEEKPVVEEPQAVEQLGAAESNGVSSEANDMSLATPKDSDLSSSEKTLSKKKIKISNGVDAGVNSSNGRSNMMGNGSENCYDGGISLAQFLAETLQSQTGEEKQSSPRGEKPKEMDIPIVSASKEKEQEQEAIRKEREEQERRLEEEYEREKRREEQLAIEREKENERMPRTKHGSEVKHHSKAHKDHEHHHIQASISSMLHSVKDFLFGKSKKDSHDHAEKERELDHSLASAQPPQPETPPSFRLQQEHNQSYKPLAEEVVPMEINEPKEPSKTMDIKQQSTQHEHEDDALRTGLPPVHKLPPESVEEFTGQSGKVADDAVEAMEVSGGSQSSRPDEETLLSGLPVLTEAEAQVVSVIAEVPERQQEPECLVLSAHHQAARDESSPREDISVLSQTHSPYEEKSSPTPTLTSLEETWTPPSTVISASDSHSLGEAPTEMLREEEISVDKIAKEAAPDSDNDAVTTVPVITVGDRQTDKADEDLSGGSTPTSSLSCESSPRLKRRDSLSLIRSATPEELASGARRKIFIPKPKEDVEGAVVGALDTQSKKEAPYLSPSQARRAALLQAPTGQNTPPMERRSPLLSRRKVTLEVPKVVEETPTEEPVSTKREEKPA
ncbi:Alpha-protein kinase 3, partial [Nibea albiflora]